MSLRKGYTLEEGMREALTRLRTANGRKLLSVTSSGYETELELTFERRPGENSDLLLTIDLAALPLVGHIDLPVMEEWFDPGDSRQKTRRDRKANYGIEAWWPELHRNAQT